MLISPATFLCLLRAACREPPRFLFFLIHPALAHICRTIFLKLRVLRCVASAARYLTELLMPLDGIEPLQAFGTSPKPGQFPRLLCEVKQPSHGYTFPRCPAPCGRGYVMIDDTEFTDARMRNCRPWIPAQLNIE